MKTLDGKSFIHRSAEVCGFETLLSRLRQAQHDTGLKDAVINAQGKLMGRPVVASVMEYAFIGGSMGAVVGEMITAAWERALDSKTPLIIVSASGGARMMEGRGQPDAAGKISSALARLDKAKVPYISVLTDPTTGGVTASFAMLGDLNIGGTWRPDRVCGAAGDRAKTIRQKLPAGFQRSEFLLEHGMLDAVVARKDLKPYIARAMDLWLREVAVSYQLSAPLRAVIASKARDLGSCRRYLIGAAGKHQDPSLCSGWTVRF